MKSHYDTLGVEKDATKEEVKKAFRRLSMLTHPDIKGTSNSERFKQISEAYGVLSNEKKRRIYDIELHDWFGRKQRAATGNRGGFGAGSQRGHRGMTRAGASTLLGTHKNLAVGLTLGLSLGFASYALMNRNVEGEEDASYRKRTGEKNLVEAWKTPSGEWRTPAPWDRTYRKLQPELHFVPREQVRESRR